MRRYLIAILSLVLALPSVASAQWYLFPGGRPATDSTSVAPPTEEEITVELPYKDPVFSNAIEDDEEEATALTRVALILPLKSTGTPNSNFLDFYCGALMAADMLCSETHRYRVTVYDSTIGLPTADELDESDLVIGPVSLGDVETILPRMRGRFFVSPLDPKVTELTEQFNVIQAPSGWEAQADELVRWLAEDLREGDSVVLLQNPDEAESALTLRIASALGEAGIAYGIQSAPPAMEDETAGSIRCILASENDEFCSAAVREIALLNLRGGHGIVYSTSRLRANADLEVESLHAAAAHITASYYADPGSIAVQRFTDNYRSLFKGDPGQWVFQGYDLMKYFVSLAESHPGAWAEHLAENPGKGLQTDFVFGAGGKTNTAVRRLKYNANNTISVIK